MPPKAMSFVPATTASGWDQYTYFELPVTVHTETTATLALDEDESTRQRWSQSRNGPPQRDFP